MLMWLLCRFYRLNFYWESRAQLLKSDVNDYEAPSRFERPPAFSALPFWAAPE